MATRQPHKLKNVGSTPTPGNKKDTKRVGEFSESQVMTYMLSKGFSVSIPWGDNQPYDLIVDNHKQLLKIQCKTGRRLPNGDITFTMNPGQRIRYNTIDGILVVCEGNFYAIGIDDVTTNRKVRINKSKQKKYRI